MWSIEIYANPGIAHSDPGPHLSFSTGDEEFGDLGPYFSSPHLNNLTTNEISRVKARIITLLRLYSGIKLIQGYRIVRPINGTLYYEKDFNYLRFQPEDNINLIFEELANPFDLTVLNSLKGKKDPHPPNQTKDYFQLATEDQLVREVLLLITLGEEQALYFLVNTYKIVENILSELCLSKNNGKVVITKKTPDNLPKYLLESLNNVNKYAQYINSRDASGILSRHGVTKIPVPDISPTFSEIRNALFRAVNDWLNYKCVEKFGRNYKK